ncbi:MAG: hypothetical protein HY517_04510 [Candidatus Aenigmarchaeota archaeon]|nr:hypothetical protein [Candidatus Aenigmarchaeota archaeon]
MPELRTRRQFLLNNIPTMAYAAAFAPEIDLAPKTQLRYGEITPKAEMSWYSWPKIQRLLGLRRATEGAFYERLQERYAQLTKSYNNATGNGDPDFKKIFGLGRNTPFAPPTKDIPGSQVQRLMRMDEVLGGNTPRLRRLKATVSYEDRRWSISLVNFADGNRIITPGLIMPFHRGDALEYIAYSQDVSVTQYASGVESYYANLHDGDMSHLVPEPDMHALLDSIDRNLSTQVWLSDLDEQTFRDAQVWQRESARLTESEAVKRYLTALEEAKKPDGVLDSVSFSHPYPVMAQPGDETSDRLELHGEGIFQKGVHERIEMPVDSPMAEHAVYMDKRPYSRKFMIRDLPKEDARLLQEYFTNVINSMRQVDAVFSRV